MGWFIQGCGCWTTHQITFKSTYEHLKTKIVQLWFLLKASKGRKASNFQLALEKRVSPEQGPRGWKVQTEGMSSSAGHWPTARSVTKRSLCSAADSWPVYKCLRGGSRALRRHRKMKERNKQNLPVPVSNPSRMAFLPLTGSSAGCFQLFEGVSHLAVKSQTSEHEEENQTQLKAEGQHAQHHDEVVNCWRYRESPLRTRFGLKPVILRGEKIRLFSPANWPAADGCAVASQWATSGWTGPWVRFWVWRYPIGRVLPAAECEGWRLNNKILRILSAVKCFRAVTPPTRPDPHHRARKG